jgi:uncharacterized protein (DUF1778 family)
MARQAARTHRVEARISPLGLRMIKRAAEIQGRSVSEFVVQAAEEAAERTIRDMQVIEVTLDHQEAFVKAMLDPPKEAPIWKRARETHRRLITKSD